MNEKGFGPSIGSRSSTGVVSQESTLMGSSGQNSRISTGVLSPKSSPGTIAPCGSAAFQAAIRKFGNHLSGQQLVEFQNTTYRQLCQDIYRVQKEQENSKNMMNLSRIQGCLEAMNEFGKTIEVFLNVSDAVAFVWGPVKFLLLIASNFADSFETLLDAYEQIGEQLPLLQEYESLFHASPHMTHALELMYIDILEFHQQAMRFFSGKLWRRFFRSMWKDFGTKFNGILKSLQRHKDLVECRATISQYHLYRRDIVEIQQKLDQSIAEQKSKKMKAVKEWLAVGTQPKQDHDTFCKIREEFPTTGRWIVKHEVFQEWLDTDLLATPIVWMTGIPGAGKTILASKIIDECKSRKDFITSHFYCHYEDRGANTAVAVLRGLVDQLLDQYQQLLPQCHARHASSGEPSLQSFPLAKKLFEDFSSTVPKMFIVVDGLDECEPVERKQLLDFFVEVVSQADADEPGKLRVLFVSQESPDIKRALYSSSVIRIVPKRVHLSSTDNEGDIATYVEGWVDRIAEKFSPFQDDWAEYLRHLTVSRAKGMFLYAKLVMDNLHKQPTRGHLLDAISEEVFPDGLKEAYERIVQRIKRDSIDEEWQQATKLLGWMVCCKRQLTWREIQVALSINPDDQTIDYDDRSLRYHNIQEICGSLVLVMGDRVALVHSTAKSYLTTCTKDIDPPSIECELATICLQYLTFPCFTSEETASMDSRREWMLSGHFAFQDYALAQWFQHINAFVNSGKSFLHSETEVHDKLGEFSSAIDDFVDNFAEENFHDAIVSECQTNCEAFKEHEFYEDLVALTSHIYTVQKKGFDARHQISIKKLDAALQRNRKLLEEAPTKMKDADLKDYNKFYNAERRFKCTRITCMYFFEGFKDAKSRKRHVNVHERPYQCDVPNCLGNEGFANTRDLDRHKRSFHPEASDLAESFNSHRPKKGKTTHTCPICGKSFTRKQIQEDHVRSHKGERPHECAECGKAFTRKNDWRRHTKLHERP